MNPASVAKRISAVEIFAQALARHLIVKAFFKKFVVDAKVSLGQHTPAVASVSFIAHVPSASSVVSRATVPFP